LTKKRVLPAFKFHSICKIFNQRKDTLLQITRLSETPVELSPYDINLKIDWSVPDYFNNDNYTYYTMMEGFENNGFFKAKRTASVITNYRPANTT